MAQKDNGGSDVFVCDPVLDIAHIGAFRERLEALLAAPRPLILDASGVERVDTAVLQLLTVFVRAAQRRGMALTWRQASEVFLRSAVLLGLDGELGLPRTGAAG
jgi:anti-anti-sigma regulatory factor